MVYETGKAAGSHMFKDYVERLYELKERGVPGSKDLLNSLWGVFGQKYKIRSNNKPKVEFGCRDNQVIEKITLPDSEESRVETTFTLHLRQTTNPFKTPFARQSIFLPALGRFVMSNILH